MNATSGDGGCELDGRDLVVKSLGVDGDGADMGGGRDGMGLSDGIVMDCGLLLFNDGLHRAGIFAPGFDAHTGEDEG